MIDDIQSNKQENTTQVQTQQENIVKKNSKQENSKQENSLQQNTFQENINQFNNKLNINNNHLSKIDKCDNIRNSLKNNNVDVNKYNICYTKSLTIHNDSQCTLCRHDKKTKSFICRPNFADEEIISAKDFCMPLKKLTKTQLNNTYYQNVIDICTEYKKNYKKYN